MKTRIEIRQILLVGLILTLGSAACSPASEAPEVEAPEAEAATSAPDTGEAEATAAEPAAEASGAMVIEATDACAIISEEQVAAAFGKEVVESNADTQSLGSSCEYTFDPETNTEFQINIYTGDAAKAYFAGLAEALDESCEAFLDRVFDVAFGQSPTSEQDINGVSLAELYTNYVGKTGECMFVQNQMRPDVGENVISFETIFLNWSSNVAVLGEDRVVELTYQEPIPEEVNAELQAGTDRDSFYALAQPYRDSVLAGYTEILIGLLQEGAGQ